MSVNLAKAPAVNMRKATAPLRVASFIGESVERNNLLGLAAALRFGSEDVGSVHRRTFGVDTVKHAPLEIIAEPLGEPLEDFDSVTLRHGVLSLEASTARNARAELEALTAIDHDLERVALAYYRNSVRTLA